MTKLLVSVRSLSECEQVLQTRVGLVDLKEPQSGSLGAVDFSVAAAIARRMNDDGRPWSLALGELRDVSVCDDTWQTLRPNYVKLGLSGTANWRDWQHDWRAALDRMAPLACPVSVAYADAVRAECVSWREVLSAGLRVGSRVLLVDTYDKSAGNLRSWVSDGELSEMRVATRSQGVSLVLAGSLGCDDIVALSSLRPDWFAVRSLVTCADRAAPIDPARVQAVLDLLELPVDASLTFGSHSIYENS